MTEVTLPSDSELFKQEGGIRYPNFAFWWSWIESLSLAPENDDVVWTQLQSHWVSCLNEDLGSQFHLIAQNDFIILSSESERRLQLLLEAARKAKGFIKENVVTAFDDGSPILIIVFQDHESYTKYIAPIYKMGGSEVLPSIGVFLSGYTYPHVVLVADVDLSHSEAVLRHELAHFFLSAYQVPRWLDEGLAQVVEKEVFSHSHFLITQAEFLSLAEFWSSNGLDSFWTGESFASGDGHERFSYQLAELVVRNLASQDKEKFQQFIREASLEDGGVKAANDILMIDLPSLVLDILD